MIRRRDRDLDVSAVGGIEDGVVDQRGEDLVQPLSVGQDDDRIEMR